MSGKNCYTFKLSHLMAFIAIIGVALSFYVYFQTQAKRHRDSIGNEGSCQSNLNNILLALLAYDQSVGHLPPPFTTDENGIRIQSWRATLAPWFSFGPRPELDYHFDKPWDSVENREFAKIAPSYYRCPAYRDIQPPPNTSYFMINDLSTFNLSNAPPNAILIVEIGNIDHDWLNPNDDISKRAQLDSIRTRHPRGFGVILCDFTMLRLKDANQIEKKDGLFVVPDSVRLEERRLKSGRIE